LIKIQTDGVKVL